MDRSALPLRYCSRYAEWADALEITHPFIAWEIHRQLQKAYEHEAKVHDTEVAVERRSP
jgi:hypothetical protein